MQHKAGWSRSPDTTASVEAELNFEPVRLNTYIYVCVCVCLCVYFKYVDRRFCLVVCFCVCVCVPVLLSK